MTSQRPTFIRPSFTRMTLIALMTGLSLGVASHAFSMGSDSTAPAAKADDYKKAVDLIDDEKYAAAIPLLQKSIKEKGEYADALNQLGFANRKMGNWKAGMEYYLKALALEPKHLGANEYLGELYLEQKDLPNAEKQLAVLKAACDDCDEFDTLEEAIDDYKDDNNIN
ncbi:tetratricopeptide repeat protein [Dongia rigui]|uniref:Tetratricopeptide repeat protein n=1 Tax=Dongia rigui TaxID=940149 RepID=A0ABU5DX11_9PROT|nr:tetratricopeptide repeat protein [Dongia rigui]MDY0871851.1 tetratricopeptide repeat protein [Dongia rigui]